jgi:hypothetical protein
MSASIELSGDIEVFCFPAGDAGRSSMAFFDGVTFGDRLALVFGADDASSPPYSLKIVSPSGATLIDTIVRDLPTGLPQSPPPVEFVVSTKGVYRVEIREMRGRRRGEAQVRVG